MQFERAAITPKAFANFSPGFELARTLGSNKKVALKPWKGSEVGEPFQG
jgi:hypothetical protein